MKYNGYKELAYLHPSYFKPDQRVLKKLGVKKEDNQRDASWHIYDTIFNVKKKRLGREMELASSVSDQEKLKSLDKIGDFMQSGYNETLGIYNDGRTPIESIGSIMDEWVPAWFSGPDSGLGQQR